MANESTLMAHLIPHLTDQVENAATEALGYILNKSEPSRDALADMLREGGFDMPSIVRVSTEVRLDDEDKTRPDETRPDMSGYGENGRRRLLVESKFWAALLPRQASGYLQWVVDETGPAPAALLFLAPGVRLESLWSEIVQQIDADCPNITLRPTVSASGWRRADVEGAQKRLALVSWDRLLSEMSDRAGDDGAVADIRQLQGLAQQQDDVAFMPARAADLSADFARRAVSYANLVDDVVDSRGVPQGWMSIYRRRATPQRYGYGRYFQFVETGEDFWFGVNYEMWADGGNTPLWMCPYTDDNWFPIHLKLGAEYHEVLEDVASQLKEKARDFGANPPS